VAYLHTSTALSISLLLACLLWMPLARVVRGITLELREKEYVDAARAMGASDARIILRHIVPNAIGSIAVAATVMTAGAVALETTLAYLGFGISKYARGEERIPSLGRHNGPRERRRSLSLVGAVLPGPDARPDSRGHLLRWRRAT
jgi:ABC-type dipeptide/oligopeptide/nickel transport system permease subunit